MKLETLKIHRYFATGLISNTLAYLLYSFLTFYNLFGSERTRLVVSALTLFPFIFLVNRKFVFKSDNRLLADLARYSVIYFAAIIYGLIGLTISLMFITNPYLAQAASSIVVLTATFIFNNYWSFQQVTDRGSS